MKDLGDGDDVVGAERKVRARATRPIRNRVVYFQAHLVAHRESTDTLMEEFSGCRSTCKKGW